MSAWPAATAARNTVVCFCPACGAMGEYPVHGNPQHGQFITCTKCGEESTKPTEEVLVPEPGSYLDT